MSGKSGKMFSHEELNKALMDVEDLMARAFVDFFPLHKTAQCIKYQNRLEGDAIYVGISIKHIRTRFAAETISDYTKLPIDSLQSGFEYMVGEVPVKVKVITRNYGFYKYPDRTIYEYGDYLLPNPFDTYWKARFLVR